MDLQYNAPRRARDFRRMAWQALKSVWGIAIVVALVAGLLGANTLGIPNFRFDISFSDENIEQLDELEEEMDQLDFSATSDNQQFEQHMRTMLRVSRQTMTLYNTPLFRALIVLSSLITLVGFIIGGPIKVGYARFRLKVADGRRPLKFKELFSGFDVFGEAFLLNLRIALRIIGWSLLFVIPGIIAAYRYAQAFNIMAEHPELTSGACIERSKAMMNGNKWRLFCLQFSYIGWAFLTALTFGILGLWVAPYAAVAETFFYREVSGTLGTAREAGGMYGRPENYGAYDPSQYNYGQQQQTSNPNDDFWKNW